MKFLILVFGFVVIAGVVNSQRDVEGEDVYEEEDEEDDNDDLTSTTTTKPTTAAPPTSTLDTRERQEVINATVTGTGSLLETAMESVTERVYGVFNQVGSILSNSGLGGKVNVTGIVDATLGIRNSQAVRPLVTNFIHALLCNQYTYVRNSCHQNRTAKGS